LILEIKAKAKYLKHERHAKRRKNTEKAEAKTFRANMERKSEAVVLRMINRNIELGSGEIYTAAF